MAAAAKNWRVAPRVAPDQALVEAAGGSELVARLLLSRGIDSAGQAERFLDPRCYTPASPMELPGMSDAIVRIAEAVDRKEQVTVYGDYDVDGVSATSLLYLVLKQLGARVDYYIPSRSAEGYGLNLQALSILASKNRTKLIITCDCGISNFAEINFARSFGVDTIICDHHTMPELLPPASAILHPGQLSPDHPLSALPGVGVAYKLAEALTADRGVPEVAHELVDLVALGMIADLVPLTKENRYLVQRGMQQLTASRRPGLRALLNRLVPSSSTDLIGFGLAPRINAVGRLSDARLAVELFTTDDDAVAESIAARMEVENQRRQQLCEKVMNEAVRKLEDVGAPGKQRALVVYDQGWHQGVVGIVASRLVEKYNLPAFVGELDLKAGTLKGSARSVKGIDLWQVLKANEHLIERWGGHKMAAGFSLAAEKAEIFARAVSDTVKKLEDEDRPEPVLEIDAELPPADVSMNLAADLERLAPFGMGNRKPVFMMAGLTVSQARVIGWQGNHARLLLTDARGGATFEAVFWRGADRLPPAGSQIDVAFSCEVNSYGGRQRLQLNLADWRCARQADLHLIGQQAEPMSIEARASLIDPASSLNEPAASPLTASGGRASEVPGSAQTRWKDLRNHSSPSALLSAAASKLGDSLVVFSESGQTPGAVAAADRTQLTGHTHLILWQYPPALAVLQSMLTGHAWHCVYLIGGASPMNEEPAGFLQRLLACVRFAVNKRQGMAGIDKLAAAIAASQVSLALGLACLGKLGAIEWSAGSGRLQLNLLGQPRGNAFDLPEFGQLASCLADQGAFRAWLAKASLKEIASAAFAGSDRQGESAKPELPETAATAFAAQASAAEPIVDH